MSISVTLAPVNTEVSVSSANDIAVSLTNPTTTVEVNNQAISLPQSLGTTDSPTFASITASAITASQTLAPTTDTSISVSEFAAFAGKKIIYTGGAGEIDLPAAVAADNGKSWVIINAGTGALTIDVDGSGTAQFVRFLSGGSVATSNSANKIIAAGGSAELICIVDGSATNSTTVPNYLIYGGGIS
tara:strand:- start:1384 stop:1944 length:561 start_codon:yes stop_codon:yes gene_type:complete